MTAGALEGDEHWRGRFVWPGAGFNSGPSTMIVYQGKLIVGGGFTLAGGNRSWSHRAMGRHDLERP